MAKRPVPIRVAAPLAAVALALAAAGCQHRPQSFGHSGMALDYEARHPIVLARVTQSTSLDVGIHARAVTGIQRSDLEAFARAFQADGEGTLAISVPSGTANERAAAGIAREVQAILAELGVPARALQVRPYRSENGAPTPPLLLSYTRLRAAVSERCMNAEDMDQGTDRGPWYNHGCAYQTNLAAMVANPNDLVGPRPFDRPLGARRYTVLDNYARGSDTTTEQRNANQGAVSSVGTNR